MSVLPHLKTSLARRFLQRRKVARRHGPAPKNDVTLHANKLRVGLLLVQLVVEDTSVIRRRRHVTTVRTAARSHGHLRHLVSSLAHPDMAFCALGFSVHLMSKGAGGSSSAPRSHRDRVVEANRLGQLPIEIDRLIRAGGVVTTVATLRQRSEFAFLVVTGETITVSQRESFERALL